MRRGIERAGARVGFTLLELLLALSLLAILVVALVNLIDTSLRIWGRTESERDLSEVASAVLERIAADLGSLDAGPRGDLLCDWTMVDMDGDAIAGAPVARLRLVRRASEAELLRLGPAGAKSDLVEVAWSLLPNPDGRVGESRSIGLLSRGERSLADEKLSFFDRGFFDAVGKAPAGSLGLVTGGILWFELDFATQTSVVNDGWTLGSRLEDCATSWDAWSKNRPDQGRTPLNEPGAGMPPPDDLPILPRRVKIKLEIERISDLIRRPRVAGAVDVEARILAIDDPSRLPQEGAMILVDEEWMEVQALTGNKVHVRRGARGTTPRQHAPNAVVHFGRAVEREVPIPLYREDWDL